MSKKSTESLARGRVKYAGGIKRLGTTSVKPEHIKYSLTVNLVRDLEPDELRRIVTAVGRVKGVIGVIPVLTVAEYTILPT